MAGIGVRILDTYRTRGVSINEDGYLATYFFDNKPVAMPYLDGPGVLGRFPVI
jgi:hypothetical protein